MTEEKKVSLAVFDLDGTLFDTGRVNYYAYKQALEVFGIPLEESYFVTECNGRHYTEFLPTIMGTRDHIEAVHHEKKLAYARNLDKARMNQALFQMIRNMRKDFYTAVVTTASRKNTMDILQYFACTDLFDIIITQEDIKRVKPDPEGFLKAMEHFSVSSEHTVIFEDSPVGIQAARASGASVIIIDKF